jgi:hypothetical protein
MLHGSRIADGPKGPVERETPGQRPGVSLVHRVLSYGAIAWTACAPLATATRQIGWLTVGKKEFATAESWPVSGLSSAPEIDASR